ncbi:MAG TPA: tetratricopeptide repeat protein [Planctomycetaceae bacterium]|jgi:tetratricopeptide (TPR) repeat protein|nr:tetratricopeptide repeat protein [Planctomycetaceae bacterium]
MPAHNSNQPHSDSNGGRESAHEQARLDEAMRRADHLLVSSLKGEDRRRTRRKILGGFVAALGLTAAAIVVCFAVMFVRFDSSAIAGGAKTQSAELSAEGWQLFQQQSLKPSIEKFEAAAELDPKNADAWNGLGWANFNGGDTGVAQEAFKKAVSLEPKHSAALNGLGQIALSQHNFAEAEKYFLKATPKGSGTLLGLAKLYLLTGQYGEAEKWIQKVIATGEIDSFAKEMLKAAQAKQIPAALREQLDPNPTSVELVRAWGLLNQERGAVAKAILTGLLAKNPKDANVLNALGWCLLFEGDANGAKPYFERALAVDPKAAGSLNGLARVLYAQKDVEGAIAIWKQMVEKIPGVHAGTVGLADAYLEKGDYDKALPLLEQRAASDPKNEEVQSNLKLARDKTKAGAKKHGP